MGPRALRLPASAPTGPVFGAERDERFDWTRFEVVPDASSHENCADGGWEAFGFENQGQCVRFVNGGGDSRP